MAPIDLPKHKPDFVRPQTQDGLPDLLEPGQTLVDGPHHVKIEPLITVPTPQDNRMPSNMPPKLNKTEGTVVKRDKLTPDKGTIAIWNFLTDTATKAVEGAIRLLGLRPAPQDKRKRAEGIVDPTLPDVADAFDKDPVDDSDKLPGFIAPLPIAPVPIAPVPIYPFRYPSNDTLIDGPPLVVPNLNKRDGEIVDPTLPDVADVFDKYHVDLKPDMQAKETEGGRISRECAHGGAHCKPRMRGHGSRKHQPNEAVKAIDDALERRDQSESVLTQGSWEAACQNPTFENAKFCQGMVVQPRAGGSAGAGIAAAAAMSAATAGHSAQGSLDILRDESSAYHWLLIALGILVSLLLVVVVYYSAKKIRRQRAERAQAARAAAGADTDAFAIELQPMGKNGRRDGGSKC